MQRDGYDPDFLDTNNRVPLPNLNPRLAGTILKSENLKNKIFADYVHYTVVMNRQTRQLVFAASNIDQERHVQYDRDKSKQWEIDNRIDPDQQLDNDHYFKNEWDKGHMVQRSNTNWGDTINEVKKANDDSFFYTNAVFQHANFNRDEWLALENYLGKDAPDDLERLINDKDGKLCVFTGPIHLHYDRYYTRNWHDAVRIPSGFFKIICFIHEGGMFTTRAFIMYQDKQMLKDRRGSNDLLFTNYQVTISEIEELTGLEFASHIAQTNPLYFNHYQDKAESLNIGSFPERVAITSKRDIIDEGTRRVSMVEEDKQVVVITTAMVDPEGQSESSREWVTIQNISGSSVDITGWSLEDHKQRTIDLEGTLQSGSTKKIMMRNHNTLKLTNTGGSLKLKNNEGKMVSIQKYSNKDIKREDLAIQF